MNNPEPIEEEKIERRVPHGRHARVIDEQVRMHHRVGAVFERDSEADSWSQKSVQASQDKQSDPDK